jgi:hypothetical protein
VEGYPRMSWPAAASVAAPVAAPAAALPSGSSTVVRAYNAGITMRYHIVYAMLSRPEYRLCACALFDRSCRSVSRQPTAGRSQVSSMFMMFHSQTAP